MTNSVLLTTRRDTILRPVSLVHFDLTDRNAFDKCIYESVKWLASKRRCHGIIPDSGFNGAPFNISEQLGANPTRAVRVEHGAHDAIWSARQNFPDIHIPQRNWVTEITVVKTLGSVSFGARLTNITRGEDAPYTHSIPGVALQILSLLSTEKDGFPLSEKFLPVSDLGDFCALIENKDRTLPVIAVSQASDGGVIPNLQKVEKRLAGTAHLCILSQKDSWSLTQRWGKEWSVFNGALRIYQPNISIENDSPRRHTLFLPENYSLLYRLEHVLAAEVLPHAFSRSALSDLMPRFDTVRSLFDDRERKKSFETGSVSSTDQILKLENEIKTLSQDKQQESDAANELLSESDSRRQDAENSRDIAWAEAHALRCRLQVMDKALKCSGSLPSYTDLIDPAQFHDWYLHNIAGQIVILPAAIKETQKHGTREIMPKLAKSLILLKDYYVPMRMKLDGYDRDGFERKCQELEIDEDRPMANPNRAKNVIAYTPVYKGQRIFLDRHIRYKEGYDMRKMFRIYFTWDADGQVVVVGHMPTHLDNDLTN